MQRLTLRWQIRKLAFKIVHSTTKLLPAWREILHEKKLPDRLIPRDVRTRWNSTFDMLDVALQYKVAVNSLCAQQDSGLRAFELSSDEWTIAGQLRDVLKVRTQSPVMSNPIADC